MNKITIIGLGNYGIDELPLGIYRKILNSKKIYVRTLMHPVIEDLKEASIEWISFDEVYQNNDAFSNVYQTIVDQLKDAAKTEDIIYAVPGHPMIAETTTELLIHDDAVQVEVIGGKSFIDDMFTAVQYDPNNGFQMLDGTDLKQETINVRLGLIVTQVYDQMVASDVKVTLLEKYPPEHQVAIVTGAKSGIAKVEWCPLCEMDYTFELSNLTSLYVPKVTEEKALYGDFDLLNQVMDKLVSEDGCPFDRVQTHESLKRYLIEESYELMEAIDQQDDLHIIEELGDLLLQVVLHAAIGKKEMMFDIKEIVASITDKMIRRHPHVFGDAKVDNIDELMTVWNKEKENEGKDLTRVKQEKIFADVFLKLYDLVNNENKTLKMALKEVEGELDEA